MVVSDTIRRGGKDQGAEPHVVVMFGATGDLARRKLLPGLLHLLLSHLAPEIRIIGTSLDELDNETFRKLALKAFHEFRHHDVSDDLCDEFANNLIYVPQGAGPKRWPGPWPSRSRHSVVMRVCCIT